MLGSRLASLLKSKKEYLLKKLEPLINKALSSFPDRINIDDDLYIALQMPKSIDATKLQISIPINASLQSESYPFLIKNNSTLPDAPTAEGY